jgi:hypothetical protein
VPYENIESSTPKLGGITQNVQNVHYMYQTVLDRLERKRARRQEAVMQGIKPFTEASMESMISKQEAGQTRELEGYKEGLYRGRLQDPNYRWSLNQPEMQTQADLNLLRELNKPGNEALKNLYFETIKAKGQTSHFSSTEEDRERARQAMMISPESYIADKHVNFLKTIAGPDGEVDPRKNTAYNFRTYLDTYIGLDEKGGVFDRNPRAYKEIMNSLDMMVNTFYEGGARAVGPIPGAGTPRGPRIAGKPGEEEVPFGELSDASKSLQELLANLPEMASDERIQAQRVLSDVQKAIQSPEKETRSQLRQALEYIDAMLKAQAKTKAEEELKVRAKIYGRSPESQEVYERYEEYQLE